MVTIKSLREIEYMRQSGAVLGHLAEELKAAIAPGVTGLMLDHLARTIIADYKATPSFLNYHGFPAVICVSVNEQLIHGIPNNKPFKKGDLVSIDMGAAVQGYHADAAFSVCVGDQPSASQAKLLEVTSTALLRAIEILKPGVRIGDIGALIQKYVESHGFHLPTAYTGHGIGKKLHEDPAIPNVGQEGTGITLKPGMTICIEPMVQTSTPQVIVAADKWTVIAADKQDCSHFEHTILITETGCEVLTLQRSLIGPIINN